MFGMRPALFLSVVVSTTAFAQTLAPKPSTLQHVTVAAASSASSISPGRTVTLWAEVTPKPNIHVYASDSQGLTPVTLVITPRTGMTIGKVRYPVPELSPTLGVSDPVPIYRKPFRLAQPITLAAPLKAGDVVAIAGVVNYQACDDRLCYPVASMPISWTVNVR